MSRPLLFLRPAAQGFAVTLLVTLAGCGLSGLLPLSASSSEVASEPLAVIFPEIEEPYRSFFLNMVRGIEELWMAPVRTWPLSTDVSPEQVLSRVRQEQVHTVVVLGRSGLTLANELAKVCHVVAGGVVSVPESEVEGLLVQSMAPDPAMLFGALRGFKSALRRVFVVQDPRQNSWLMRLAREVGNKDIESGESWADRSGPSHGTCVPIAS